MNYDFPGFNGNICFILPSNIMSACWFKIDFLLLQENIEFKLSETLDLISNFSLKILYNAFSEKWSWITISKANIKSSVKGEVFTRSGCDIMKQNKKVWNCR